MMDRSELVALVGSLAIAMLGASLLKAGSGDPTHRLVGGLLVSVAVMFAVVVLLAIVYLHAFPH